MAARPFASGSQTAKGAVAITIIPIHAKTVRVESAAKVTCVEPVAEIARVTQTVIVVPGCSSSKSYTCCLGNAQEPKTLYVPTGLHEMAAVYMPRGAAQTVRTVRLVLFTVQRETVVRVVLAVTFPRVTVRITKVVSRAHTLRAVRMACSMNCSCTNHTQYICGNIYSS